MAIPTRRAFKSHSSESGASKTVTLPTTSDSMANGDVIVVALAGDAWGASYAAPSSPAYASAGWVSAEQVNWSSTGGSGIWYCVVTDASSIPSTDTFSIDANRGAVGGAYGLTGVDTANIESWSNAASSIPSWAENSSLNSTGTTNNDNYIISITGSQGERGGPNDGDTPTLTVGSWTEDYQDFWDWTVDTWAAVGHITQATAGAVSNQELFASTNDSDTCCTIALPGESGLAITPAAETVNVTPGTLSVSAGSVAVTPSAITITSTPGGLTVTAGAAAIVPAAETVNVTPGTLSVAAGGVAITPDPLSVTATPGTLTLAPGGLGITPDPLTVTSTPGTLTVAPGAAPITPDPLTVNATPGTLVVTGAGAGQAITPDPLTVNVTDGTLTLSPGAVAIAPTGPTVSVAPGTLTASVGAAPITPSALTVTVTDGTLTLGAGGVSITPTGPTITVTPGGLTVALTQAITLTGPTVTATAGTLTTAVGAVAITPTGPTIVVTPGTAAIAGGALSILYPEYGRYYRNADDTRLHLFYGAQRSIMHGLKVAESWEIVSETFKFDITAIADVEGFVAAAWAANSGASQATLKAAIDAALQSAGYRKPDGTNLV